MCWGGVCLRCVVLVVFLCVGGVGRVFVEVVGGVGGFWGFVLLSCLFGWCFAACFYCVFGLVWGWGFFGCFGGGLGLGLFWWGGWLFVFVFWGVVVLCLWWWAFSFRFAVDVGGLVVGLCGWFLVLGWGGVSLCLLVWFFRVECAVLLFVGWTCLGAVWVLRLCSFWVWVVVCWGVVWRFWWLWLCVFVWGFWLAIVGAVVMGVVPCLGCIWAFILTRISREKELVWGCNQCAAVYTVCVRASLHEAVMCVSQRDSNQQEETCC